MKQKFYGISVLILLGIATVTAAVMIFTESVMWGFIYLSIDFISASAIIFLFCSKCPRKKNCPHVLPGKVAMLFDRKIDRYTKTEITIVTISFLLVVGVPQFWLRFHLTSLIVFWLLIIAILMFIPLSLCPACNNRSCPFKKRSQL